MNIPAWVDRSEYPFSVHSAALDDGRVAYVDEGRGKPIVFVHGTPTWSFLYRNIIKDLSPDYRCIAPDNLGFGLSDKPPTADYRTATQAQRLEQLLNTLDLGRITLVVHDFGGPIGLPYALAHPERIERLVLFNTWMWSMRGEPNAEQGSKLLGGKLGKLLYTRFNLSPRVLLQAVFGDKSKLRPAIHQHYIKAVPTPEDRMAMWAYVGQVLGASEWHESLWQQRERIANIPALLLWGLKDSAFGPRFLERWQGVFTNAQTITFPQAGHFVQEEEPQTSAAAIRAFLAGELVAGAAALNAVPAG